MTAVACPVTPQSYNKLTSAPNKTHEQKAKAASNKDVATLFGWHLLIMIRNIAACCTPMARRSSRCEVTRHSAQQRPGASLGTNRGGASGAQLAGWPKCRGRHRPAAGPPATHGSERREKKHARAHRHSNNAGAQCGKK